MIDKVIEYYQAIIDRPSPPPNSPFEDQFLAYSDSDNFTVGYGILRYHIGNISFYGIVDENNNKFLPINTIQHQHSLINGKRVQFCLQTYPNISNIYRWGITSQLIAVQILG